MGGIISRNFWGNHSNFSSFIWFDLVSIKKISKEEKEKEKENRTTLIKHILLICSAILIYEFIKFVKFTDIIKLNLKLFKKMIFLFKSKYVSDYRKEKLILNYSKSLILISLKIFFILICIVVIMFFLNYLSNSFLNLVISLTGIIEITLVLSIYHNLRKKINAKLLPHSKGTS